MTYFLYLVRWGLLAIPGAWFLKKVQKRVPKIKCLRPLQRYIPEPYLSMVISQVLTGAVVYFIDRWIFQK